MAIALFPQPVAFPSLSFMLPSPATVARAINDDTDEIAIGFQWPVGGTCTDVAVTTGTVTTSENSVPFRLESVGTDGLPSGTLYATNSNGTADITTSNVVVPVSINGGTGVTVTKDNLVYLRWKRNSSGTLNAQFRSDANFATGANWPIVHDYNINSAATWSKARGCPPFISVKIDGTWYAPLGCIGGVKTTGSTATSSGEIGMIINSPLPFRTTGCYFSLSATTAASTFQLSLYATPLGTPSLVAQTPTIDSDLQVGANARAYNLQWASSVVLTPNVDYALVLSGTGASMTVLYFTIDTTYSAAHWAGPNMYYCSRATTGATSFTTNTGQLPVAGLWCDGVESDAGYLLVSN